jgi:hypothetical protein
MQSPGSAYFLFLCVYISIYLHLYLYIYVYLYIYGMSIFAYFIAEDISQYYKLLTE